MANINRIENPFIQTSATTVQGLKYCIQYEYMELKGLMKLSKGVLPIKLQKKMFKNF
tara:strand:+ start:11279 stop:11449 length:171 start_codon:yes stop_codon:yes gene_type:complete